MYANKDEGTDAQKKRFLLKNGVSGFGTYIYSGSNLVIQVQDPAGFGSTTLFLLYSKYVFDIPTDYWLYNRE
jgi:hypothetical protein